MTPVDQSLIRRHRWLVLLVSIAGVLLLSTIVLDRFSFAAQDRQIQAGSAARLTRQSRAALIDMETGVRGYALSHNPLFLAPYQSGVSLYPDLEARLARIAPTVDARLPGQVLGLHAAVMTWQQDIADASIMAQRAGDDAHAASIVADPGSKQRFDAIRQQLDTIEAIADSRGNQANADRTQFQAATTGNTLALGICGAIVTFLAARSFRREQRLIGRVQAHAAQLSQQAVLHAATNRTLQARTDEIEMFVFSVSHDLRSPLVNLEGFSYELAMVSDDLRAVLSDPSVLRTSG